MKGNRYFLRALFVVSPFWLCFVSEQTQSSQSTTTTSSTKQVIARQTISREVILLTNLFKCKLDTCKLENLNACQSTINQSLVAVVQLKSDLPLADLRYSDKLAGTFPQF